MIQYAKTKREKNGICNICTREMPLSWDHVPPKGSIELTPVEMETVFQVFTGNRSERKVKESQNGVKFRTVCSDCNSFIGIHYDPTIQDFSKSVGRYLKTNLYFPPNVKHRTKPAALMRGVLGHLLAAKAEFDQVVFDKQVREFIFDHKKPVPHGIYIYYWLYPYSQIIIMRDFVMPAVRGNFSAVGFFHTLKFFPIAYLVSDKPRYEGLYELTQYRNLSIDDETDILIQLERTEHPYWPEMVDEGNILFGGQSIASSISANPRRRILK